MRPYDVSWFVSRYVSEGLPVMASQKALLKPGSVPKADKLSTLSGSIYKAWLFKTLSFLSEPHGQHLLYVHAIATAHTITLRELLVLHVVFASIKISIGLPQTKSFPCSPPTVAQRLETE